MKKSHLYLVIQMHELPFTHFRNWNSRAPIQLYKYTSSHLLLFYIKTQIPRVIKDKELGVYLSLKKLLKKLKKILEEIYRTIRKLQELWKSRKETMVMAKRLQR